MKPLSPRLAYQQEKAAQFWARLTNRRRFVFVIGDEGVVLVHVVAQRVRNAWFAPADAEGGFDELRQHLATDKRATVMVLVDIVEQLYREDVLPKTNFIDRPKVMARRLAMTYPNEGLRAAIPVPRNDPGAKPHTYTYVALPNAEAVNRWVNFFDSLNRSVVGICLLPLESRGMIRLLAPPPAGPPAHGKHWRALISLQASGGYRQIIERNDRMILTRSIPAPVEEATPAELAALIEREFRSTMGYVKRLGWFESDQLDVVALLSPEVGAELGQLPLPGTTLTIMSPHDAGTKLGLHRVADADSGFSDMLHAAWFAQKFVPALELLTPRLQRGKHVRMGTQAAALTAAGATLVTGLAAMDAWGRIEQAEFDLAVSRRTLTNVSERLESRMSEIVDFPIPPAQLRTMVQAYEALGRRSVDPFPVIGALARSIDGSVRITDLSLKLDEPTQTNEPTARRQARPATDVSVGYNLTLSVQIEGVADLESSLAAAQALQAALVRNFPDHNVAATKLPVSVQPEQSLQGVIDDTPLAEAKLDTTAIFSITRRKEGR